jgi:hypothetical protein
MLSVVTLLSVLMLDATFLVAQTNRGGITGTVFDPHGAVVAGATVTVRNLGTNQKINAKTSSGGTYTVLSLDPVTYSVIVEAAGFETTIVDTIKVDTAEIATINMTLKLGTTSTNVTVHTTAPQINVESGTTSSTVTERELTDVPLVNRSVLDLALSQPNVMGQAGSEDPAIVSVTTAPGYNLSINGGRPGSSTFLADGVNNTGVSLARTMVSFTPETVQEFSVQTSAYSAEYGTTGGGIVNATTKSGTNQFHGTALWYNRDPYFAAPPWSNATINKPGPTLKYNQFSLTAGGPVVIPKVYHGKDKTFWFAAYEPRYRRDYLPQYTLVPTDAMRQGDFSNTVLVKQPGGALARVPASVAQQLGLTPTGVPIIYQHYVIATGTTNQFIAGPTTPFPGNIIPANMLDSVALKAIPFIHEPGSFFLDPFGNVANMYNPRTLQQDESRYTVRIDHIFSTTNQINGRYTAQPTVKTQFTPTSVTTDGAEYSWSKQAMLAYTHLFTSTLFNDLRLNYTRGRFSTTVGPQYDLKTGQNLNTEWGLPSFTHGGVPSLPFIGGQGSTQNEDIEERYNITDLVYWSHGNMSWKFGVDLSHSLQNVTPLFGAIGGIYDIRATQTNLGGNNAVSGDVFASFLLGTVTNATLRPAIMRYYYRWNAMAGFVQNDWKVRPNLTLNLGVRYNLELPRTEKNDNQGVFRPDLAQSIPIPSGPITLQDNEVISSVLVPPFAFAGKGGRSRYLYDPSYLNFEPRFGFAWAPGFLKLGGRPMVLRGGYGISHLPISGTARLPNPDLLGTLNYATQPVNPAFIERLGENPPNAPALDPNSLFFGPDKVPANGLLYDAAKISSLGFPGYAISNNMHTPYSQNWNFTLSWELNKNTTIEFSYVGNKGTHLFENGEDINPRNSGLTSALDAVGMDPNKANFPDPLNRKAIGSTPGSSNNILVQQGTLASKYLGFPALFQLYDASGNSIRHAGYVNFIHRTSRGLTVISNYTYGKSIDDSQGPNDKGVLATGQVAGQVAFGAPLASDRSVSTFDQRHVWNTTTLYDLPFGHGRKLLANTWGPINAVVQGWTTAGILRIASGNPAWVTMVDSNQVGDPTFTHAVRPNIVPGVPLINPLWSRNCPAASTCQPYLNPSAFERPPLGQFGNAPRTLDSVRGPWRQTFDFSIQKNIPLGGDGRRRLQLRMDLLNALNHPVFSVGPNQNFTDFMAAPIATALIASEYDPWAAANGRPLSTTSAGLATITQINNMVATQRNSQGVLPTDFYTVQLPTNFWGMAPNSFDITSLNGYRLWRLRNAMSNSFGDLNQSGNSRYIQLGIKIFF